ncbi:MAG: SoxR reducing system RseC family protein [Dictyoglomaceae bacterium]
MKELGKVIDKRKDKLIVELNPSPICSSCNLCQRGSNGKFILEVLDQCSAEIGDIVSIELPRSAYYKATALIYIFPLLFFFGGITIGYLIGNYTKNDPQLLGFIFGLVGLAVGFLFLRALDKRIQKKSSNYIPIAKEVVQR